MTAAFEPARTRTNRQPPATEPEPEQDRPPGPEGTGPDFAGLPNRSAAAVQRRLGPGDPLPARVRAEEETRFGTPLHTVRVHDDSTAHDITGQHLARALTVGSDIVFNKGRYQPDSPDGRRLLRHELAHVRQQGAGPGAAPGPAHEAAADAAAHAAGPAGPGPAAAIGVQRNPLSEAEIARLTLPEVRARLRANEREAGNFVNSTEFDAQLSAENVQLKKRYAELTGSARTGNPGALTNQELLDLVAGQATGERTAQARTELRRRVAAGQAWLADSTGSPPAQLVSIVPRGGNLAVAVRDAASALRGGGRSSALTMTPQQFQRLLAAHAVRTVGWADWLAPQAGQSAVTASRGYLPQFGRRTEQPFTGDLHSGWIGPLGEASFGTSRGGLTDLNARPWVDAAGNPHAAGERNFPVVDFTGSSELFSVKSSLRNPRQRLDYYLKGYAEALGTQPGSSTLQSLLANQPAGTTRADIARQLSIVVNSDDVGPLRALLANPEAAAPSGRPMWQLAPVRRVYDGLLQANPVIIDGVTYTSVAALDAARGTLADARVSAELNRLGAAAAAKVRSSAIDTAELSGLRSDRATLADRSAIELLQPGEHLAATHLGGARAAGTAGVRGGVGGAAVSGAVELGQVLLDPDAHPNAYRDIARESGLGALGGGAGGAAEQSTAAALTGRAIASGGALTPGAALGIRGLGGSAGGAAGAVFVEWARIGFFEDRPHSAEEVGLRTVRSGGIGAVSGAAGAVAGSVVTSALAGTALGSAVPGVGTVIGFIVGLGIGLATAYVLESAVPQVPPSP